MCGKGKDAAPLAGKGLQRLIDGIVNTHIGQVMLIKPVATQILVIEVEPQWLGQMQHSSRARTHADSVSGVRRDDRPVKKHVAGVALNPVCGVGWLGVRRLGRGAIHFFCQFFSAASITDRC